jgi:hypothetical protein
MSTKGTDTAPLGNGSRKPFVFAYWVLAVYALVQLLLIFVATPYDWTKISNDIGNLGILILLSIAGVWCVDIFTEPVAECAGPGEGEEFNRLKRQWMAFAYGFMVFSVVATVAPFTGKIGRTPGDPGYDEWVKKIQNAPIYVFPGCVEGSTAPGETARFPELSCRHIASVSAVADAGKLAATTATNAAKPAAEMRAAADELTAEAASDKPDTVVVSVRKPAGVTATDATRLAVAAAIEQSGTASVSNATWLINIGGQVRECVNGTRHLCVSGGLVVPLHLVILSLMGGAISLTRRVPEYQKRGSRGYIGTDKEFALQPRVLREYLVFQIVQFVSAPLIAVVAYYLIEPTTTSASVAIAFAAGFASESVLLLIRTAVEKVAPTPSARVLLGSVVGMVRDAGGQPVEGAKVKVVGAQGDGVDTDANGLFVLDQVPAGECAVLAVRKDDPDACALCRVVVTPEKIPAPVELHLPKSKEKPHAD